jgi:hypothetical protein
MLVNLVQLLDVLALAIDDIGLLVRVESALVGDFVAVELFVLVAHTLVLGLVGGNLLVNVLWDSIDEGWGTE